MASEDSQTHSASQPLADQEGEEAPGVSGGERESRSPRTPPRDVVSEAAALLGGSPRNKTLRSRIAELKKEQTEAIARKKRDREGPQKSTTT